MDPPSYDFCILGAGIAGLSLADSLNEGGCSVIVLEKDGVASGASGTPGGLVNPATGRRATKAWRAEACYRAVRANLEKVQAFAGGASPFYRNNGLLRPALTPKMRDKMRRQYEKTRWPDGWCRWQTEEQVKQRHPGIHCSGGGLWLPIGLTVDVGAYLRAYARCLAARGVTIQTGARPEIARRDDRWALATPSGSCNAGALVFATGYATLSHPWWSHLKLSAVKGQVARFGAGRPLLAFDHSLSSLGYIARLGEEDEFIQGSTYEHDFEDVQPDSGGEQYLRKRMRRTLPALADRAELIDQWAGVRVTTPDKKPVLGPHPRLANLHIFTALGSKGLMYGKFLADHYAGHLLKGTPLFEKVDVRRFDEASDR